MSNERLDKIRKSIKIGSVVNACNGFTFKWYVVSDILNLDTAIEGRFNVKYIVQLKTIDRDKINTEQVYFLADVLQFALIQYDD